MTGTHASKKITLAANALQHLLPTPERPPNTFFQLEQYLLSVPGSIAVGEEDIGYREVAIMAVCPIVYGVIHFLAWGDQFPTTLEALLWRVSSFLVTFSGFVGVTVIWCAIEFDWNYPGIIPSLIRLIIVSSLYIVTIFHTLASGFLIVESFRQLSFLNLAAYQLPSWSNYWPHFS